MATPMVLTSTFLGLNSVDRSSWVNKVEVTVMVEEKDITTFASAGWKEVKGGLKSGQLAVSFLNDIADDQLDETLWALLGTTTTFEVRGTSAAVGTSNPKYTGSVAILELKPIAGQVGDLNTADYTWPTSGAVTRAVA